MPLTRNQEQVRARAKLRRLQPALRDAQQAVAVLLRAGGPDVWGRYEVAPGVPLDADDLAGWVALAQAEYPGCSLELVLVADIGS